MLDFVDVLGFIADLKQQTQVFKWISLCFQISYSAILSFCAGCGGALVLGRGWPYSIGMGLSWVAIVMFVFFVKSPLTRGMLMVAPEDLARKELESEISTTQK